MSVIVWNSKSYGVISELLLEGLNKNYPELVTKNKVESQ